MSVVSNASPLINLARIGQLELLHELYGEIYIPDAVWKEVVVAGTGLPGADLVADAVWIKRQSVTNSALVRALQQDLDAGESEAIALALELEAELLLMDEGLGRETARHLGLRFIGIIGVLTEAKHTASNRIWMPCARRPVSVYIRHSMREYCKMQASCK